MSLDQAARDRASVARIAARHGFDVVGVASVEPIERDREALDAWIADGHAGGLGYMEESAARRRDGTALLAGARSLITVAVNHYAYAPPFEAEGRFGRVARYAWGLDYHRVLPPRLDALAADLPAALGRDVRARAVVDAAPLLERAAAARSGTGFIGKNTMLILPRKGSWYLLGEILIDAELEPDPPTLETACGTCVRCAPACPTDAFAAPFVLDARKCLSYWTIEHRGPISAAMRASIGSWIFGCDVCQDVCPFNRFAEETKWPELRPEAGVGPRLDVLEVLALADDKTFRARFGLTAIRYAGRASLVRNAAIVAANLGTGAAVPLLARRAREDAQPVVRGHALAALGALDRTRARAAADLALRMDGDPFVRAEATSVLEGASRLE